MGIDTHDRAKLGQTTYHASFTGWRDDEPVCTAAAELDTEEAARAWITDQAPHLPDSDYAEIRRGTYVADDLEDDEYGTIHDAAWEQDEAWGIEASWSDPADIDWQDWT